MSSLSSLETSLSSEKDSDDSCEISAISLEEILSGLSL